MVLLTIFFDPSNLFNSSIFQGQIKISNGEILCWIFVLERHLLSPHESKWMQLLWHKLDLPIEYWTLKIQIPSKLRQLGHTNWIAMSKLSLMTNLIVRILSYSKSNCDFSVRFQLKSRFWLKSPDSWLKSNNCGLNSQKLSIQSSTFMNISFSKLTKQILTDLDFYT